MDGVAEADISSEALADAEAAGDVEDGDVLVVVELLRAITATARSATPAITVTTTRDEDLFAPALEVVAAVAALFTGASTFGAEVDAVVEIAVTLLPLVPGTGGIVIFSEELEDAMLFVTDFFAALFLAGDFLATFLAATFLAGAFFAVAFLAVAFLATLFTALFLAATFLAATVLAGAFFATFFATFLATFLAAVFFAAFFAVFFTATVVLLNKPE
jgi:hypothetical protein